MRECQCGRNDHGHYDEYSQCGVVYADAVYQYGSDGDNTYYYRSYRNRCSHRFTVRCISQLGIKYNYNQWYTKFSRDI